MIGTKEEQQGLESHSSFDLLDQSLQLLEESRDSRDLLAEYSLLSLVRQFSDEWHTDYENDIERLAQFIVAIATLMEWKALLLIPSESILQKEIEIGEIGECNLLTDSEIETFKQMALYLAVRQDEQERMLRRAPLPPGVYRSETLDPVSRIKLSDLQSAFRRIAKRLLDETEEVSIRGERVSRSECRQWLIKFLQQNAAVRFESLFFACPRQKAYWVVVFLLLLELVQQRLIALSLFSTETAEQQIYIAWQGEDRYNETYSDP